MSSGTWGWLGSISVRRSARPGVSCLVMCSLLTPATPASAILVKHISRPGQEARSWWWIFPFIYIFLLLTSKFEICRVLGQLLSNVSVTKTEDRFCRWRSARPVLTPAACYHPSPISWENEEAGAVTEGCQSLICSLRCWQWPACVPDSKSTFHPRLMAQLSWYFAWAWPGALGPGWQSVCHLSWPSLPGYVHVQRSRRTWPSKAGANLKLLVYG